MNLQENIQRIKQMMALLKENTITLPITVEDQFTGDNGDKTHAFQSTGGVVVGGMQTKVNKKLKEVYDAGINPDVTDIKVTIDKKTKKTYWSVTIDESKDGRAYLGIATVGSCCNDTYRKRADDQVKGMKNWGNAKPEDHKEIIVLESTSDGSSNGNLTIQGGKYKLKQHFYKYSKSNKPPHPKKPKN